MSRATPSPGPWEVRPGGAGGYGIAVVDTRPSAGLLARMCPSTSRTDEQQLANARMMAASRQMYLALLTLCEANPCKLGKPDLCACPTCMGWAAIARAIG